jgi:molybdenum cofactor cytidylyltransferase
LLAYPLSLIAAARERGLIQGGYAVIPGDDGASSGLIREMKLEAILNRAPERGLSFSLRLGLAALAGVGGPAGALILLGDQPLVRLDVVEALISAWHAGGGPIIRPRYEARPDVPGHPVLVARCVWPSILGLRGDAGFGSLGSRVTETIVEVAGHNPDVDTVSDLQALEVLQ